MFRVATVALLNCYSALFFKRATVATLKINLELERLLEAIFCVFTLQNWL